MMSMKSWCATNAKGREYRSSLKHRDSQKCSSCTSQCPCLSCCRAYHHFGDCIGVGGVPIIEADCPFCVVSHDGYFEPCLEHPSLKRNTRFLSTTKSTRQLVDESEREHLYVPLDLVQNNREMVKLWESACSTGLFERILIRVKRFKTLQEIEHAKETIKTLTEPTTYYPNLRTQKAEEYLRMMRVFLEEIVFAFPNGTEHVADYDIAAAVVQIAGKALKKTVNGVQCPAFSLLQTHVFSEWQIISDKHLLEHLDKRFGEPRNIAELTKKRVECGVHTGIYKNGFVNANFALMWGCGDPRGRCHRMPHGTDLNIGVRVVAVETKRTVECHFGKKYVSIPGVADVVFNFGDKGDTGSSDTHCENICVRYNPSSGKSITIEVCYNFYKSDAPWERVYGGFVCVNNVIPGKDGIAEDNYGFPWPQKTPNKRVYMGQPIKKVVTKTSLNNKIEHVVISCGHKYHMAPEMF